MPFFEQWKGPSYDVVLGKPKKKEEKKEEPPKDEPKKPATKTVKAGPTSAPLPETRPVARASTPMISIGDIPSAEPLTPEAIQKAFELLIGNAEAVEKPTFNIDDLEGGISTLSARDLPLDLRALGAVSDTLYGTKLAQNPNRRAETIAEEKAMQSLRAGSPALQQVKGQARLAEYEQALKRAAPMTQLEKSQMLLNIRKMLAGNTDSDLKASLKILEHNITNAAKDAKENREIEKDIRKDTANAQEDFRKSEAVVAIKRNLVGTRQLRNLLTSKASGIKDHEAVLRYVKNIEKDSAVMFNEAQVIAQAGSVSDRIMNILNRYETGSSLPKPVKIEILENLAMLEEVIDGAYASERQAFGTEAATRGIPAKDVVGPSDKVVEADRGKTQYKSPDGKTIYNVKAADLHKFLKSPEGKKAIKVGGGH